VVELALGVRAAPLIAVMLAGCGGQETNVARANLAAPPKAEPTPTERAESLVRQRLGGRPPRFLETRLFNSAGATVVCGRVVPHDGAEERYIVVGEEDVFLESQMVARDMDQAVRETCRDA
jgi:hypothetical protein